jgi:hypothetical protein
MDMVGGAHIFVPRHEKATKSPCTVAHVSTIGDARIVGVRRLSIYHERRRDRLTRCVYKNAPDRELICAHDQIDVVDRIVRDIIPAHRRRHHQWIHADP